MEMMERYKYERGKDECSVLKNVYCVNCGEKGHVLKECNGPITSFGIIAFKTCKSEYDTKNDTNEDLKGILKELRIKQDNNNKFPKLKFLMIQRKDTMGYIDFVRGKYDTRPGYELEKERKINVCLNEMTQNEKNNLLTKSFDSIWCELWNNHSSRCFKNEYELAHKKFHQLPIQKLVEQSETVYKYSELGFAKGRRNMRERNIECAEREFFEETGFNKSCYEFIKNYPIIVEEFLGTNNIPYRHIYYLVKMKDNVHPPIVDIHNKIQTGEVKNIGWFTIDECVGLIRPYDKAKKEVIKKVYEDLVKMKNNYNCSKIYFPPKTNHFGQI